MIKKLKIVIDKKQNEGGKLIEVNLCRGKQSETIIFAGSAAQVEIVEDGKVILDKKLDEIPSDGVDD